MLKLTIKQRLITLLSCFVITLISVGGFFYFVNQGTMKEAKSLEENREFQKVLTHIQYRLTGVSNDERGYINELDPSFIQGASEKERNIRKDFEALKQLSPDSNTEKLIMDIEQSFESYMDAHRKLIAQNDFEKSKNIHYNEQREIRKEKLDPSVNRLVDSIEKKINQDTKDFEKKAQVRETILMIIILAVSIFTIFIGTVLISSILRPLMAIRKQLDEIAHGEGDLTKELVIKSKDEIGQLAQTFNHFNASLRDLISQVRSGARQVNETAYTLNESSSEVIEGTREMNEYIKMVSTGAESQREMANQSSVAVEEMTIGINQIAENASKASELANEASIKAKEGSQSLKDLVQKIESIDDFVNKSVSSIKQLSLRSNEIGEILSIIQQISEQTNLLALNAAIEAARAGDSGRGFAVVADEVRKLAEQSSQSAGEIYEIVKQVQDETKTTVHSISQVKDRVQDGKDSASITQGRISEVIKKFEEITSEIQEVSAASEEISAGSEEVSASVQEMATVANQSSEMTQKVVKSSEEHIEEMEKVQNHAQSLSSMSVELNQLVNKFKVD